MRNSLVFHFVYLLHCWWRFLSSIEFWTKYYFSSDYIPFLSGAQSCHTVPWNTILYSSVIFLPVSMDCVFLLTCQIMRVLIQTYWVIGIISATLSFKLCPLWIQSHSPKGDDTFIYCNSLVHAYMVGSASLRQWLGPVQTCWSFSSWKVEISPETDSIKTLSPPPLALSLPRSLSFLSYIHLGSVSVQGLSLPRQRRPLLPRLRLAFEVCLMLWGSWVATSAFHLGFHWLSSGSSECYSPWLLHIRSRTLEFFFVQHSLPAVFISHSAFFVPRAFDTESWHHGSLCKVKNMWEKT